ncbi:MAG: NAD-dependent epimerase/dehydratase family protein [Propionibacteriales bacterium]|nr:NAD-dependent epimerase/dehydratase family protein [Propionibacteriales bacterium]
MKAIVTGAAGFIGSHLSAHLLEHGDEVVGIDCFTDYYDPRRKEANIAALRGYDNFTLHRLDLLTAPLTTLFESADVVYHLAGQPGVRGSWGEEFVPYVNRNVLATQRVLEAARDVSLWKVVYASSSSVYGNAETYPTTEDLRPQPVSPYGVTKLAAEHLCELYRVTAGVATVSLRFFTVYGPRQRPDMAFSRLVDAALSGKPFLLYGDGEQSRDFTYVGDLVTGLRQAALSPWTGVANIGGGSRTTMNEVIDIISRLAHPIDVVRLPVQRGDVRHTAADTSVARDGFGYTPHVLLEDGLAKMVDAARLVFAVDQV